MTPPLTQSDWEVLRLRHADHRLTSDSENQNLLYQSALVEYRNSRNGQPWCDVHPALWELLIETRTKAATNPAPVKEKE
jgi:hypothetical protein